MNTEMGLMLGKSLLTLSQRVSALELAVFAMCKTASDKDGLIAEIDRLTRTIVPPSPEDASSVQHFEEIKRLLDQYRAYTDIGKTLRPGE